MRILISLLLLAWMAAVGFVFWLTNGPYLGLEHSPAVTRARAVVEPLFRAHSSVSM